MAGRDRTRRARPRRRCFEDRAAYRPFPRLYCVAALACRDWQGSADAFVQVRSRLFAGGNRIRTIGPSREMRRFSSAEWLCRRGEKVSLETGVGILGDRWFGSGSLQRRVSNKPGLKGAIIAAKRSMRQGPAAVTLAAITTRPNTARPGSGYPSVLAQPGS
jgi:hypothetical protein